MGKRDQYRDSVDPEYQRWGRKYPRFPGVAECIRLILDGKARGAWADIVAGELAAHANDHLQEMIDAFHSQSSENVRLYMMDALEAAALPASVPFLIEVLANDDERFVPYAERALQQINTKESRAALYRYSRSQDESS